MDDNDVHQVSELLADYLNRFDMAQMFSREEILHWLIHPGGQEVGAERVIWSYVVEQDGKITDFFSFYRLESTVIKEKPDSKNRIIKAAYLFYYATSTVFEADISALKVRLNDLMGDLLILAKQVSIAFPCQCFH